MEDLKATGLCPICRHEIPGLPGEPASARQCVRCTTWYHDDCWDYGGGCAIFGCEPSARPRPCPEPPRERGPFWRESIRFGLRMAAGMMLFLMGSMLGLIGWGVAGPLALPVILILGWCSDSGEHGAGALTFRRGVLFGPVALVVMPFPVVFLAAIPAGLAIALAGLFLRAATGFPVVTTLLTAGTVAALSWSHQPEGQPVPFSVVKEAPTWATSNHELGHSPYVLLGDRDLAQAWRVGLHIDGSISRYWADSESCSLCTNWFSPLARPHPRPLPSRILEDMMAQPDAPAGCRRAPPNRPMRRVLVMPWREMRDPEVVRIGDAVRVRYGATLWRELADTLSYSPFLVRSKSRNSCALVLPELPERVELQRRSALSSVVGARLEQMLTGGAERPVTLRAVTASRDDLVRWLGSR